MKNLKSILMITAIIISVSASFAKVSDQYCEQEIQYFRMNTPWGFYYVPAGTQGEDYTCLYSPFSSCTYYRIPGTDYFFTCKEGQFYPACVGY